MEELNSSDFVFADRGIIVNLIHIVSIQDTMIELDNGEFLPASLARIKELKLLLQKIMEEFFMTTFFMISGYGFTY